MLKPLKRSSLVLLKSAGLLRALKSSAWRRHRLLLLGYQGVSIEDEHQWDPSLYLSPRQFEQRLELLRRTRCCVLPLAEAVERLYRRDLPPRSVAITFDDGTTDFYARAWPLLRSYGYPAAVFLTAYYCDFNRPIFELACPYLLWKGSRSVDVVRGEPLGLNQLLDLRTQESRAQARQMVYAVSREWRLDGEDADHLLERLAEVVGADYKTLCRKRMLHGLRPEEVSRLAADGVDFQLHVRRRRTPIDREHFVLELTENRERVAGLTGRRPDFFCHPHGAGRAEYLQLLAEAGIRYAVTSHPGFAAPESNPLLLPRFVDHGRLSPIEFESWVAGLGLRLPARGERAGPPVDLGRLRASNGF